MFGSQTHSPMVQPYEDKDRVQCVANAWCYGSLTIVLARTLG